MVRDGKCATQKGSLIFSSVFRATSARRSKFQPVRSQSNNKYSLNSCAFERKSQEAHAHVAAGLISRYVGVAYNFIVCHDRAHDLQPIESMACGEA